MCSLILECVLSCSPRSSHARCFLFFFSFFLLSFGFFGITQLLIKKLACEMFPNDFSFLFFFCFFSLFGITQLFTLRLAYEVFPDEKQVHDTATHHPLTPLSIHRSALETGFRGSVFPITTYYYYILLLHTITTQLLTPLSIHRSASETGFRGSVFRQNVCLDPKPNP
jgi:hypothetical protein